MKADAGKQPQSEIQQVSKPETSVVVEPTVTVSGTKPSPVSAPAPDESKRINPNPARKLNRTVMKSTRVRQNASLSRNFSIQLVMAREKLQLDALIQSDFMEKTKKRNRNLRFRQWARRNDRYGLGEVMGTGYGDSTAPSSSVTLDDSDSAPLIPSSSGCNSNTNALRRQQVQDLRESEAHTTTLFWERVVDTFWRYQLFLQKDTFLGRVEYRERKE